MQGIEYARDNDFGLVIALDCGIKSIDYIAHAASIGIDFIICDHHLPDAILPPAVAILNPKQDDCPYPYKELSGCGIGFKLISALAQKKGIPMAAVYQYLDLVSTSIAADIVPMTGENRVLAFHGLKQVNEAPSPGIKALLRLSNLKEKLTTQPGVRHRPTRKRRRPDGRCPQSREPVHGKRRGQGFYHCRNAAWR